jgi:hypothetical protein
MTKLTETASDNTSMLEVKSLQLDIQTIQRTCEEDKLEFDEFCKTVNTNFASI